MHYYDAQRNIMESGARSVAKRIEIARVLVQSWQHIRQTTFNL